MSPDLDRIILSIYDAALEPRLWPSVLDRVSELVDARGAFVFDIDRADKSERVRATFHTSNYEPKLVQDYLAVHNEQELEDQAKFAASSRGADEVDLIPDTVLAPSRNELMQRANAQAMASYGIQYRAGALLNKDHYFSDRFALQFSGRAGLPSGTRLHLIRTLMPHIAKALNIGRQTSRAQGVNTITFEALNHMRLGICLVSASGTVVFKNTEFDRQLDAHKAFLVDPDKRLVARNQQVRRQLDILFSGPANHGKFGARPRKEAVLHPLGQDSMALCIEVSPLFAPSLLGERNFYGFALFSLDTTRSFLIDTSFLADTFSLTEAEEIILRMLAEGLTNAEISERRERSLETISSQVKSLLSKTMSNNRTQLIRLATEFSPKLFLDPFVTHSGDEEKAAVR